MKPKILPVVLCGVAGALIAGFFVGRSDPQAFIAGTIGTASALLLLNEIRPRRRRQQP